MSGSVLKTTIQKTLHAAPASFSYIWQGGEPTLAGLDFFKEAVALQQQFGGTRNISNALQTNGTLLTDEWYRFFKKHDFLVGISLDGPEHVHNKYRKNTLGEGTWQQVLTKAKECSAAGVATNILSCVTNYAARYPEEIFDYLTGEGFRYIQFIPVIEKDAQGKATSFSVAAGDYGRFLCRIFDRWVQTFEEGRPTVSVRFFETLFFTLLGHPGPECGLQKTCGTYLAIEHTGDIYPCDFFIDPAHKRGNIMTHDPLQVFNSREQCLFGGAKANVAPKCIKCKWRPFCNGGCLKDRKNNPRGFTQNYFCASMKTFLPHAMPVLKELAARWRG